MSKIKFQTKLTNYNNSDIQIFVLPKSVSAKMPSRGMVMVSAVINNQTIQKPLEPDGKGGHFLVLDKKLASSVKLKPAHLANIELEVVKDWTEPEVPKDLKVELNKDLEVKKLWNDITPMARWDWIRWIDSTKNPETRKRRINITHSKLKMGKRRPCCFNRSECILPYYL